jgi:hypothetical protein
MNFSISVVASQYRRLEIDIVGNDTIIVIAPALKCNNQLSILQDVL